MVEYYLEVLSGKGSHKLSHLLIFDRLMISVASPCFLTIPLVYRIIRAFLVEEQKIVKKVLKIQKAKEKQAAKS